MELGLVKQYEYVKRSAVIIGPGATVTLLDIYGTGRIIYMATHLDGGDSNSGWASTVTVIIDGHIFTDSFGNFTVALYGPQTGPEYLYQKEANMTDQFFSTFWGRDWTFRDKFIFRITNNSATTSGSFTGRFLVAKYERTLII